MRSRIIRLLPWILIVAVLYAVGWVRAIQRVQIPTGTLTVENFAASMPAPQRLAIVPVDGRDWLVWIGPLPRIWGTVDPLASGPPCYLFDDAGQLRDWTTDIGDDHHLDQYVVPAWKAEPITVEQAIQRAMKHVP